MDSGENEKCSKSEIKKNLNVKTFRHFIPTGLQSFSKNLFKSLMGLVLLELCGWLPSIFFGKILQLAKLDGIQSNYVAAAFAVVSTLTASANLPMLYAFRCLERLNPMCQPLTISPCKLKPNISTSNL
jgi:hypothetical protein